MVNKIIPKTSKQNRVDTYGVPAFALDYCARLIDLDYCDTVLVAKRVQTTMSILSKLDFYGSSIAIYAVLVFKWFYDNSPNDKLPNDNQPKMSRYKLLVHGMLWVLVITAREHKGYQERT